MVLALVLVLGLAGCSPGQSPAAPRVVCVTTRPLQLLVEALVNASVEVRVLSTDGIIPVQNAASVIKESAILFVSGLSEDAWATSLAGQSVQIVRLSDALQKGSAQNSCLSFRNSTDMARLIRDALISFYPSEKADFDTRYATFLDQCSQADGRLKQQFWKTAVRAFIAADGTWVDAAGDYGLRIIIQPSVRSIDPASTKSAAAIDAWGAQEHTHTIVLNDAGIQKAQVVHEENGVIVCKLDAAGAAAGGGFVSWLEVQLTALSQSLEK